MIYRKRGIWVNLARVNRWGKNRSNSLVNLLEGLIKKRKKATLDKYCYGLNEMSQGVLLEYCQLGYINGNKYIISLRSLLYWQLGDNATVSCLLHCPIDRKIHNG
jgi:hypothetical protein